MDTDETQDSRIARARTGDREAFDTLVETCRDRLARLVSFRLGASLRREVDVEDILQETFLRAFQGLDRFTSRSTDSFFRWLSGVARHVILERSRRLVRADGLQGDEEPAESISPSRAIRRGERLDRLQEALDSLSPEYRHVLRGALVERLPLTEIARRLGKTPNAVSLMLLRANRKLRESFGDTQSLGLPARELDWGGDDVAE